MVITCPECGHQGKVDPSKVPPQGARAKCPKCQSGFVIQRPQEQAPAPQAAPAPPQAPEPPAAPSSSPPQPAQQAPQAPPASPPAAPPAPESSLGFAGSGPEASAPPAEGGLSLKTPAAGQAAVPKDVACTGCLKLFKENEITQVGDRNLCQSCQEAFQAKAQVPSAPASTPSYGLGAKKPRMEYGGFWIRVGAYLIDGFLLGLIFWFIVSPIFMKMFSGMFSSIPMMDPSTMDQAQMQAMMAEMTGKMMRAVWITNLINMALMGGYFIVLEGGPGQTLGKKALGLRVVTPEGERIGYLKAFARYVGRIISGVILCIGFIMAAFDDEKRTLHDRMVNTRVIKV